MSWLVADNFCHQLAITYDDRFVIWMENVLGNGSSVFTQSMEFKFGSRSYHIRSLALPLPSPIAAACLLSPGSIMFAVDNVLGYFYFKSDSTTSIASFPFASSIDQAKPPIIDQAKPSSSTESIRTSFNTLAAHSLLPAHHPTVIFNYLLWGCVSLMHAIYP